MAWVKLDDQIARSRKHIRAGGEAAWFWVCAIAYSSSSLTDGFIAEEVLPLVSAAKNPKALAERLANVGLFDRIDGGYMVHDYFDYNEPRAMVLAKREKDNSRKRREYSSVSKNSPRGEKQENQRREKGETPDSASSPNVLSSPLRTTPLHSTPSPPANAVGDCARAVNERAMLAEQFWTTWREVFPSAPASATPKEFQALCELAETCAEGERFRAVAHLLVTSPAMASKRGIGMLRAKWAELSAWLDEHPGVPFGAARMAQEATRHAPRAEPVIEPLACPHDPHCGGKWECQRKTQLEAARSGVAASPTPLGTTSGPGWLVRS